MRSNTAVLLAFAASASAAVNYMAIPHVRRELNLPRATSASDSGSGDTAQCASAAISIVQSMPTPPPQLVSDLANNPQTDPCSFNFPQSLKSDYSSYQSEVLSWFSGHKDELTSLASVCTDIRSYTDVVNTCSTDSSGTKTRAGDGSDSDSPAKTAGSQSKSTNAAAAQETGMAFAALAVAGIAAIL
ncbi:hypothetical protein TARUN_3904 [Trichoderma arundinaceum]|uniref:DUF7735 domain-containing protein n=1 Tax=Trichoderma arundinaceum TaxID=490622 RepID=A0A395NR24_TRIAR|nr:hypothetical protein TARUN_3904 [Trichoderma arundinaceum]